MKQKYYLQTTSDDIIYLGCIEKKDARGIATSHNKPWICVHSEDELLKLIDNAQDKLLANERDCP